MNAPLDAWGAETVHRARARDGDAAARAVWLHLHEAFIELVTTLDNGIRN